MSRIETYFLLLVVLNLCVTAAYVLWNEQHWREEPGKRTGGRIRAAVMLLAPVIGPVFFVAGELARHLLFGQSADLEDVIFSKERVRTHFMADEEQERNVVPIEEALAISDRDSLRTLIMNVVRGDVTDSLGSLALALDSEDTETSHYAASVLRDVLNDFRQHAGTLPADAKGRQRGGGRCLPSDRVHVCRLKTECFSRDRTADICGYV